MTRDIAASGCLAKGLVIYGQPAVGKSTLELNLRLLLLGSALTQEDFQTDGLLCFMGKTARRDGGLMATGGAEALSEDAMTRVPEASWYIAAIPSSGRPGAKLAEEFFKSLQEVYAVCLYSERRGEFKRRRTLFFSGREPLSGLSPARPCRPDFVAESRCTFIPTEPLWAAVAVCLMTLGIPYDRPYQPLMLEDIASMRNTDVGGCDAEQ